VVPGMKAGQCLLGLLVLKAHTAQACISDPPLKYLSHVQMQILIILTQCGSGALQSHALSCSFMVCRAGQCIRHRIKQTGL